nr:monovalent cation/H(+) antiporter subunit G [uncultured Dethiosulfovibrio sp.]
MKLFIDLTSGLCLIFGVFFSVASVIGLLRFPDVYTRLHAGTKALSGGAVLVLIGVAMRMGSWQGAVKAMLIIFFFLATNPLASHAIARACYRHGIVPYGTDLEGYRDSIEGERK